MTKFHQLPTWIKSGLIFDLFLIISWLALWYFANQTKSLSFTEFHQALNNLAVIRYLGLYGAILFLALDLFLTENLANWPIFYKPKLEFGEFTKFPEPTLLTFVIIGLLSLLLTFSLGAIVSLLFTKLKNLLKNSTIPNS